MARTFEEDSRNVLNHNIYRQDNTFKLKYFKLHGLAYASRLILATSGAKWECAFPEDWANTEKKDTLFGVLPVLYETTASGQIVEVPESDTIEHYLSKKFRLYGNGDDYDEIKVRAFASSIQSLISYYLLRVAVVKDAAYKDVMTERFFTEALPPFLVTHERHLVANGRNGHYVGDKLSLADLKLVIAVNMVVALTQDKFVSQERTPAIWAVWEKVNAIPSYVEWKKTKAYKEISERNLDILGF
ncbi:hypothetical protein BX616_001002 [Lobosporangium transversale]|uniref:Glutathione S-transferase n=1 Tax=Lobosporangium transversale TaxID=64571 RepID=A0A1Y2GC23_9FUNG|nr:hypothetical protein BCR41DRAFT_374750 [Lobosporangium transversale]KAF9905512.1 hypothetical protein BX616_001002 [Lobosporangium transversale]ORZ04857.1 hypothetical protein BCR41DRAFT_374750 [Lobosporangium transversale]|eukprot:XP_021876794.1 hypothetical protein BCR41DRAFT_374750 [Lobosporangium transversale]